jgi:putative (di)nucleoside polyphosphate hydrolase
LIIGNKKYRPNVAAVIVSTSYPYDCNVFVGRRTDRKDSWQFPQGGIDEGESPKEALFRELKEEIGTKKIEIIAEYPEWLSYDFPSNIKTEKMEKYDGQIQKYYLVKLKSKAKINLDTKHAEFDAYKFIKIEEVLDYIIGFKKPVYSKVLHYFKKEGYL